MDLVKLAKEADLLKMIVHTNVVEKHYESVSPKLEKFAALVRAPLQAKIDSLMLEYCPDEMTDEQLAEWGKHQSPADMHWVDLTDDEILEEYRQSYGDDGDLTDCYFARAVIAVFKEKNK